MEIFAAILAVTVVLGIIVYRTLTRRASKPEQGGGSGRSV